MDNTTRSVKALTVPLPRPLSLIIETKADIMLPIISTINIKTTTLTQTIAASITDFYPLSRAICLRPPS